MRRIVSLGALPALLVLTIAGPCLACSTPGQTPSSDRTCCHRGGCDKPAKTPTQPDCANPDMAVAAIEKSSTPITHAAAHIVTLAVVVHSVPVIAHLPQFLPPIELYSPPDLCVLHSVFNV